MKKLFFTLCSNNYLAQAKILGDSVLGFYPDSSVIIGLIDYLDETIDYGFFQKMEILPFEQLGFPEIEDMLLQYNIIEFNTAVKPFYIDYLWKKYGNGFQIVYLDPDILLYKPLDHVFSALQSNSVVLTPMFFDISNYTSMDELIALRHGMFNLGFIALKWSDSSKKLIDWWKERLRTHCLIDKAKGLFVDQKWMDLAPLLFDDIFILKHKGYNMAWWNFSERKLIDLGSHYAVNNEDQHLHFYHFSGFKPGSDSITGRSGENQFSYDSKPEIIRLGKEYEAQLLFNRFDFFSKLTPKLTFFKPKITPKKKIKIFLKSIFKRILG